MKDKSTIADRVFWPERGAVFAALLMGLAAIFSSCQKAPPPAPPPPNVVVATVVPTNLPMSAEFIGQLDSPQNVEVRARVEAFVDKMFFTEGTEVKEGDRLFQLDDRPYRERLDAAKGALAEAKAALNKYEKDVARLTPLAKKRAVPQQDLDNALAAVDVGKASIVSAQAQVESAKLDVSYCDVRAPITGLIGAKQVNIGELVGKGQPTLLAVISKLDPIWFYCNVSEVDYLKAEKESARTGRHVSELPVMLILANGDKYPDPGKFVFIDRAVDPKTGTLRVRAEFPNAQKQLRPGMFGRIRVDTGIRTNSILVPQAAVVELQGKYFVWVVGSDNKTVQRPIKTEGQYGENTLVLEGLKPGDRIVVEGLQKVKEGAVVKPLTAAEMSQAEQAVEKPDAGEDK